ncbi:T9SS type A sorting domain-containing protein [Adhaeribacter soli]|uniref:T9SS type A sorting domain-containing protein n=1 Tax=Adhaeribacter soli TaxID=2607655 RepID=A0A5N1IH54_9BACT|nr:T9SS type A sorting domain-containing protein [Adhaeribacter soli]KAA9324982.1 T9SS type A sorting domain-containing protein [Adhaeribacter soli]
MKHIFTFLFSLFSFCAWSQGFDFRQENKVKVVISSDTLRQPWMGGLNAPVYSKIDLNLDGVEDLYAFDRMNNKSYTFLADNTTGTWRWKYAPEYEALFPKGMTYWVLLRDVDGDGRKDLFTGNNMHTLLYKNVSPAAGPLTFVSRPHKMKFDNFSNIPLGAYVLPSFTDMDNDGDLDMLVYDGFNAETIEYYKNLTVEQNAPADSMRLTRETTQWGGFSRCSSGCNAFVFGSASCRTSKVKHGGGASITALDLDGDSDKDILVGADMCPDLVRLTNAGTPTAANMVSSGMQIAYPNMANPASMVNFPAAYYEDVTFDGKKDLLVAPFLLDNQDMADLNHSSWLYQNTSATIVPTFTFQKKNFLQDQMLDLGAMAAPAFADIDADGDLDMLVSNFADYRLGASQFRSTVSLFENVGSATKPVFKLVDNNYLQFSQADYKGIKLQFGDMDGNGSKDLIVKYLHSSGSAAYVDYIPNSAQPNQPYSFSRANQVGISLGINVRDAVFFYDLDGDGDLDVLLGTDSQNPNNPSSGAIHYYRRVGANPGSFSSWQLFNDNFGNIPRDYMRASVQPIIADLDNNGVADLALTDNSGSLRLYPNIMNNLGGTFIPHTQVLYNNLLGGLNAPAFGPRIFAAAADLDGDQKPEMVVGTDGGGLLYLKNESSVVSGVREGISALPLKVYPNPAREMVTVSSEENVQVSVYDMTGRQLLESKAGFRKVHELNILNLKAGAYFLKISTPDFRSAGKTFIVQH